MVHCPQEASHWAIKINKVMVEEISSSAKNAKRTLGQRIGELLGRVDRMDEERNRQLLQSLPPTFFQFLKNRLIDPEELVSLVPRYIRVKPNCGLTQEAIIESLGLHADQIVKVDGQFFAIPPQCKINPSRVYEEGLIYGMDYSSAMAARCLGVEAGHTVLELCSAPGNKSMYLADQFQDLSVIKGVQINFNRAQVMKSLLKKYKLHNRVDVIVEDGLTYKSTDKFDRVLIDAECTHEGSIKHLKKFMQQQRERESQEQGKGQEQGQERSLKKTKEEIKRGKRATKQQCKQYQRNNSNPYTSAISRINQWTMEDFQERFLDPVKLNNLRELQIGLLRNGFSLLKSSGVLVYSTCSFDEGQNQQVIRQFLEEEGLARLEDCREGLQCACEYYTGTLDGTIHFSPAVSHCGGMFVSKIRKVDPEPTLN